MSEEGNEPKTHTHTHRPVAPPVSAPREVVMMKKALLSVATGRTIVMPSRTTGLRLFVSLPGSYEGKATGGGENGGVRGDIQTGQTDRQTDGLERERERERERREAIVLGLRDQFNIRQQEDQ